MEKGGMTGVGKRSEWWGWLVVVLCLAAGYLTTRNLPSVGPDDCWELLKIHFAVRHADQLPRVWNDQPWLHTLLNARLCQWFGEGPHMPRLFTVVSMAAMWAAIAWMGRGTLGAVGLVGAALLMASVPRDLLLIFSIMLEPAAWAWAVVAAGLLSGAGPRLRPWQPFLSGAVMGAAMHLKLTAVITAPGLVLYSWRRWGFRESLRLLLPWLAGWVASFGLWARLSPNFRWDWLLGSHWMANQHASADPATMEYVRGFLGPNVLVVVVAGGFGLLTLRALQWPAVGMFAVGTLLGALAFKAIATLWWWYYEYQFVLPLSILGGLALVHAVRVLQAHWSDATKGPAPDRADQTPPSPKAVASAVLTLSTVAALWAGFGAGRLVGNVNMLLTRGGPDPIVLEHMRATARSNLWCYAPVDYYVEMCHAGVFPPPELLVLPRKRFLSGQISWQDVVVCLESNQVDLLVIRREAEKADPTFSSWLMQHCVPLEVTERMEIWRRRAPGEPPWDGKDTRLGR
ncbi:hypothetical protein [Limisphaera sp. 4302-co]|uniref:hypothetical protein n=1 Tax=Limisphaera sp. 4302-co TaxID=3400417 RepID=UPI003C2805B4